VTLSNRLKDKSLLDDVGGIASLSELMDSVPSAENLAYYVQILKEKSDLRATVAACTRAVHDAKTKSPDSVIDNLETNLIGIRQRKLTTLRDMKELTLRVIDNLERRAAGGTGLATGFRDLDRLTGGGLQDADMWVIAARPNCGKTAWAMCVADQVAAGFRAEWLKDHQRDDPYDGLSVAVFSLEMTDESITERLISRRAMVNTRRVDLLSVEDQKALIQATSEVGRLPMIVDDTPGLTIGQLRARARRYYTQNKARLIVVDYLQLVASDPSGGNDRRVQVDSISRGLKSLAKELRIPIIVLAQLNREFEKEANRKPRMSDLRESGQIEQDADVIGFLYPDKEEEERLTPSAPRTVLLRVGKQRNGPKNVDVPFRFSPEYVRFDSISPLDL
jgi:replicative DNA helicase